MQSRSLLVSVLLLAACTSVPNEPVVRSRSYEGDIPKVVIDWAVTVLAPGAYDQPNYALGLKLYGYRGAGEQTIDLGIYAGSFADGRESPVVQEPDALLTGGGWFAGAGDEFIVRRTGSGISVLHRTVDEEVEPGDFTELKNIPLDADVEVETE